MRLPWDALIDCRRLMTARRLLRLLPALAVLALSLVLTACGSSTNIRDLSEAEPVALGDLQYNVVFSRFLNPNDSEDKGYLVGQPIPKPSQTYLGVFMQINNKGKSFATVPSGMKIVDTQHNIYYPLPTSSPYALRFGDRVGPEDQVPAPDSAPQVGPIGGSMILFVIPDAAIENRPLQLIIPGPGGPARVVLDI